MTLANCNCCKVAICLILLLVSLTSHAEIYKWIDENGQTHFSERKGDSGKAKIVELKEDSPQTSARANQSSARYWQEQEILFRQRQFKNTPENLPRPSSTAKPKSLSGGKSDESDLSRCNLARDVFSGAVSHPNGAPTDKHDRDVAENDVRAYCH